MVSVVVRDECDMWRMMMTVCSSWAWGPQMVKVTRQGSTAIYLMYEGDVSIKYEKVGVV